MEGVLEHVVLCHGVSDTGSDGEVPCFGTLNEIRRGRKATLKEARLLILVSEVSSCRCLKVKVSGLITEAV